jgi:hypothetical protein
MKPRPTTQIVTGTYPLRGTCTQIAVKSKRNELHPARLSEVKPNMLQTRT